MPPAPYHQLQWPAAGLIKKTSFESMPPFSTPAANNVRPDEAKRERARGGARPGWGVAQGSSNAYGRVSANPVYTLQDVLYNSSGVLTSKLAAIDSAGAFYYNTPAGGAWTNINTQTFRSDIPPMSADYRQLLYILGKNNGTFDLIEYDPALNTLAVSTPFAGTIPTKCTIVVRHGDRIWLMGDTANPNQWYASAVGSGGKGGGGLDFSYGQNTIGTAISGSTADAGQIGEPIRAGIAHTNLCFVFGCDTSMWIMRGDPAQGGQISMISSRVGIMDRFAWCHDPSGNLWFISHDGLYMMDAGCYVSYYSGVAPAPHKISRQKIPQELVHIDRSAYQVCMAYDLEHQGIHITITKYSDGSSTVWWFSPEQQAFWPATYGKSGVGPLALCVARAVEEPTQTQSTVLHGCWDGYVRNYDENSTQDDATSGSPGSTATINSYIDFGPFPLGSPAFDGVLSELQLVLDADFSGTMSMDVRVGENGEQAFNASAFQSHTQNRAGLNYSWRPMARGHAAVIRLNGTGYWGYEDLVTKILPAGLRRIL